MPNKQPEKVIFLGLCGLIGGIVSAYINETYGKMFSQSQFGFNLSIFIVISIYIGYNYVLDKSWISTKNTRYQIVYFLIILLISGAFGGVGGYINENLPEELFQPMVDFFKAQKININSTIITFLKRVILIFSIFVALSFAINFRRIWIASLLCTITMSAISEKVGSESNTIILLGLIIGISAGYFNPKIIKFNKIEKTD